MERPDCVLGMCSTVNCHFRGIVKIANDTPIEAVPEVIKNAGQYLSRALAASHDKGEHEQPNPLQENTPNE